MDLEKVKEELQYNLNEWGVQGNHTAHVSLRKKIISAGLDMAQSNGSPVSYKHTKSETFPDCINEAYEFVLRSDVETLPTRKMYHCSDNLGISGFGEPFFRWYNKRCYPPEVTGYKKKESMKSLQMNN